MSDVAHENKEMTLKAVDELFRKRNDGPIFHQRDVKNYVKHVKHMEKPYWKTDRIIGVKLDIYISFRKQMLHNLRQ